MILYAKLIKYSFDLSNFGLSKVKLQDKRYEKSPLFHSFY